MKQLLLLIALLFPIVSFSAEPVIVTTSAPEQVIFGTKFQVKIQISKPFEMQYYSHLEQSIGNDFTVESDSLSESDFSVENNKINFTWFRIPEGDMVTISYTMIIPNSYKQTKFVLSGKLYYLVHNVLNVVEIESKEIEISVPKSSSTTNNTAKNNLNDKKATNPQFTNQNQKTKTLKVVCERQKPFFIETEKQFIVVILIEKGNLLGSAVLNEELPDGYEAIALETAGGDFTFDKKRNVQFKWAKLPETSTIAVAYQIAKPSVKAKEVPNIVGIFTTNGESYKMAQVAIKKQLITNKNILALFTKQ